MRGLLCRFCACHRGATAIEYAIIAMLISVIAVAAMTQIGLRVSGSYNNAATAL